MKSIVDLSTLAGRLAEAECEKAGIPFKTDVQIGLASGLDVALTLMEESAGFFRGLGGQSVERASAYFRAEAERSRSIDPHIAIWYESWAKAVEMTYLNRMR